MDTFCGEISLCKTKPVVLSVVQPYSDSYVLSSRRIPTVPNLFDAKYLHLSYPELLDVYMAVKLDITKEQIEQVERDTVEQAKGINFASLSGRHFSLCLHLRYTNMATARKLAM